MVSLSVMDHIGVVGLSYRHASVEDVARFAIPRCDVEARLPDLRTALHGAEVVFLATCNRVEVIFATGDASAAGDLRGAVFRALRGRDPELGEAAEALRAWTGEAAVEHVFLLACGLNSAQAGEHEITAQLRSAWDMARAAEVCGPTLNRLMNEALSMASRVHRLSAASRPPSLADLAVERLLAYCGQRRDPVALVGVSPMTRRCGQSLRAAGVPLVIVNRSAEVAEEWAQSLGARCVPLHVFRSSPPDVAAIIVAAGGSGAILDEAALRALAQAAASSPLIIDFGLPPNVEPAAAQAVGLTRIGMNELIEATREQRLTQLLRLAPVRAAIDERLARLRNELATRAIGRRLADLRDSFEGIAAAQMDQLLADDLRGLDDAERQLLRRFATTLARRLAHLPLAGIRAAAAHASADTVDAFFRAARLQRAAHTHDADSREKATHER
jgi:glutamyl-tRNA reductase